MSPSSVYYLLSTWRNYQSLYQCLSVTVEFWYPHAHTWILNINLLGVWQWCRELQVCIFTSRSELCIDACWIKYLKCRRGTFVQTYHKPSLYCSDGRKTMWQCNCTLYILHGRLLKTKFGRCIFIWAPFILEHWPDAICWLLSVSVLCAVSTECKWALHTPVEMYPLKLPLFSCFCIRTHTKYVPVTSCTGTKALRTQAHLCKC